jgi:phosphate starvation-inducible PhoH-like protein
MNDAQAEFMDLIEAELPLVFGLGPAGTGKTYITTAMAADALANGTSDRIIVTRPAVEAGESLGFLPGTLEEKFTPYLAPVWDVIVDRLGPRWAQELLKAKRILPIPLNFMRGLTLKNCWVLADEMQNSTPKEMKMLLSRIGDNCKMLVSGDVEQADIGGVSGLEDGVNRMRTSQYVGVHEFTEANIVRSGLAKDVVIRYRR